MHESVNFLHVQCLYKREMFLHKVLYASISAQKDFFSLFLLKRFPKLSTNGGGGGGGGAGVISGYINPKL